MAKLEDGEYVTIEEFIDGDFTKYLNNTGLCYVSKIRYLLKLFHNVIISVFRH